MGRQKQKECSREQVPCYILFLLGQSPVADCIYAGISDEEENMAESAADTGDGETVPETEMSETAGIETDIQNGAEEAVMNMKVEAC